MISTTVFAFILTTAALVAGVAAVSAASSRQPVPVRVRNREDRRP